MDNITNFFYEVGTLRKIARSHRQTLLTDDLSDNIASHSFRTTVIGHQLAIMENADTAKVILMCLYHDVGETRTGDLNWIHKKYVSKKNVPQEFNQYWEEYEERKSLEAKIAKDADLLDQILLLNEYVWQGNKEAVIWLKSGEQEKALTTLSAKKLAKEINATRPSSWWY